MRILYAERQRTLVSEIREHLGNVVEAQDADAGMHLIAWLKGNLKAEEVATKAPENGVYAQPLSFFCMNARLPEGLLLGYTGLSNTEIRRGIRRLGELFDHL